MRRLFRAAGLGFLVAAVATAILSLAFEWYRTPALVTDTGHVRGWDQAPGVVVVLACAIVAAVVVARSWTRRSAVWAALASSFLAMVMAAAQHFSRDPTQTWEKVQPGATIVQAAAVLGALAMVLLVLGAVLGPPTTGDASTPGPNRPSSS